MNETTKDLLNLVFQLVGFVNTFWGVYATVTIALLGWLFSSKHPWPKQQKLAIALAYALAMSLNCAAQYRFNLLVRATVTELNRAIGSDPAITSVLRDALRDVPLLPPAMLVLIHVLVDSAVLYLICIQHRFSPALRNTDAN